VGSTQDLQILPTGRALGAEVRGVDLTVPIPPRRGRMILDAYFEHQALFFRGQTLTDQQLLEFSRLFGEPMADYRPKDYHSELDTDVPHLVDVVSNVIIDGKPIGALGAGEVIWHSDTVPLPNSALVLHALEVPEEGGINTRIASTRAAYDALPDELRERVHNRILVHGRQDYKLEDDGNPVIEDPSKSPGPWFPLVRTHGDTHRPGLFLGRQGNGYIIDLPVKESNALLEQIWTHVTRAEFVWEHEWQVGDVLVWDNRCTVHSRGRIGQGRRRLHRTTVSGEWPR